MLNFLFPDFKPQDATTVYELEFGRVQALALIGGKRKKGGGKWDKQQPELTASMKRKGKQKMVYEEEEDEEEDGGEAGFFDVVVRKHEINKFNLDSDSEEDGDGDGEGQVQMVLDNSASSFSRKRSELIFSQAPTVPLNPLLWNSTHTFPITQKGADKVTARMHNYFGAQYLESGSIDTHFLKDEILENQLHWDRQARMYDSFMGNRLIRLSEASSAAVTAACNVDNSHANRYFPTKKEFLGLAGGDNFNEVSIQEISMLKSMNDESDDQMEGAEAADTIFLPTKSKPSLIKWRVGNTPVNQIVSPSKVESTVIIARSMEGIHFCDANETVTTLSFDLEPMHFALNSKLHNQGAVILQNGSLQLLDLTSHILTDWDAGLARASLSEGSINYKGAPKYWKKCEYGPHPRQLLICNPLDLRLADLRISSSASQPFIYSALSDERLSDFALHPSRDFQVGATTSRRTLIFDTRYSKSPLLSWNTNNCKETQLSMQFVEKCLNPKATDTLLTWGRITGEVLLYSYDQFDSNPPQSVQIQKYPSFHTHPLYHSKSFTNQANQTYQDYFMEIEVLPPLPILSSCTLIPHHSLADGSFTIFQMDEYGSLFAQAHSYSKKGNIFKSDNMKAILEVERKCLDDLKKMLIDEPNLCQLQFEADHEIHEVSDILNVCEDSLDQLLNQNELKVPWMPKPKAPRFYFETQIESLFECDNRQHSKVQYTEDGQVLPLLGGVASNLEEIFQQAQFGIPPLASVLNYSKDLDSEISSLSPTARSFKEGTKEVSVQSLKTDLSLADTVFISCPSSVHVNMDDGSHTGHHSKLTSPLWVGSKDLIGVPSWLLGQWANPRPFEALYISESDDGMSSSGKSAYSSTSGGSGGSGNLSDYGSSSVGVGAPRMSRQRTQSVGSTGSGRPLRVSRTSLSQSRVGSPSRSTPLAEPGVAGLSVIAPPLFSARLQSLSSTPASQTKKKKRKLGF